MSETPAEPAAEAAAAPSSSKGALIPILIGVINLGATGFVAAKVMRPPPAPAVHAAHEEEAPEPPPGPMATLDPFVINLNEPGSNRYLKASFEVELASDKGADAFARQKGAIRDELLRYLSGLAVADTQGEIAKNKIHEEIVTRVDRVVGKGKVKRIYFTDFVVQ